MYESFMGYCYEIGVLLESEFVKVVEQMRQDRYELEKSSGTLDKDNPWTQTNFCKKAFGKSEWNKQKYQRITKTSPNTGKPQSIKLCDAYALACALGYEMPDFIEKIEKKARSRKKNPSTNRRLA